jgi:hypothetical protein
VQQIAVMVARHWPAFFEKELGVLPHAVADCGPGSLLCVCTASSSAVQACGPWLMQPLPMLRPPLSCCAGPLPEYIYAPCCAEFLVSAERIRKRPLAFYQHALDLANNMDAGSDHVDVALAFE